jgi:predicted amidohydrolase
MAQTLAAVVQTRTPATQNEALAHLEPLVRAAADAGARLIATPEGSNLLQRDPDLFRIAAPSEDDPALTDWASGLARELGVTLLIGSALLRRAQGKAANRAMTFGPDGAMLGAYDKIHLFDVSLGPGQELRESDAYAPGARAVAVDTAAGRLGLTICYDLRFPHLFRTLAQAGAELIAVPAAFTATTGPAHWEPLLRARAIETGAYVLAPAQGGLHADGRRTHGRSMIVDPWGGIVAHLDHDEPGFALATIDCDRVQEARAKIPAWALDRPFALDDDPR